MIGEPTPMTERYISPYIPTIYHYDIYDIYFNIYLAGPLKENNVLRYLPIKGKEYD